MNIFFIPFHIDDPQSNLPYATRSRMISKDNKIVGVPRYARFFYKFDLLNLPTGAINITIYVLKVLIFAVRKRKSFNLIYCFETPIYNLLGVIVSIISGGKPVVRDCAYVTREWCERFNIPKLFRFVQLKSENIATKSKRTKKIIVLSEKDKSLYLEQGFDGNKIEVIPRPPRTFTAEELNKYQKSECRRRLGIQQDKRIIVFTGQRQNLANVQAAIWINNKLAPAISKKHNDVQILETGARPLPEPVHPAIKLLGYVEDYFSVIFAADICIIPVEMPSGRLGRAFDSLSCGIPTVVLESAKNGIPELVDNNNSMVSKNLDDMVEKTLYLLEHPVEAQIIGNNGKNMMDKYYSISAWGDKLNTVIKQCIEK